MSNICAADLHHLKPGKRVLLKSFNGSLIAPQDTKSSANYWLLIGSKAVVSEPNAGERVLVSFERDLLQLGLTSHDALPNSLRVLVSDLKFICRY